MKELLSEKAMRIILAINGNKIYASKLARQTNTTYSHTIKIISKLKEKGIVKSQKDGRITWINLSKKGKELKESIVNIQEFLC